VAQQLSREIKPAGLVGLVGVRADTCAKLRGQLLGGGHRRVVLRREVGGSV
jgi:hypothetical protein